MLSNSRLRVEPRAGDTLAVTVYTTGIGPADARVATVRASTVMVNFHVAGDYNIHSTGRHSSGVAVQAWGIAWPGGADPHDIGTAMRDGVDDLVKDSSWIAVKRAQPI